MNGSPDHPLDAACFADHAGFHTVEVAENAQLARDTWRVRFHCPDMARRFLPGQFLMMRLAGYEDPLFGSEPLAALPTPSTTRGNARGRNRS